MKYKGTIFINTLFLLIYTSAAGFVIYDLFRFMNWWNPIFSGIVFGIFSFICILPSMVYKINERYFDMKKIVEDGQ